jgi:hypothetical protein
MTRIRPYPLAFFTGCLGVLIFCCCVAIASQDMRASKESYFPLSVGNLWVYSFHGHSQAGVKTIKWRVTQKEVIHGTAVFHLWQTPAQDDEPFSLSEGETGIVEAGSERFLLKYPLRTGDHWSSVSRSLRAPGKSDTFEVISAGKACSVGGRSFDDCVTVRETDEANDVASMTTYARGVGPVKCVYFKSLHSEQVSTTLTIDSWQVH